MEEKNPKKSMTTQDVDNITLILRCKDNRVALGVIDDTDTMILNLIAEFVKFIEVDTTKITELGDFDVRDIIKKGKNEES